jgi:DNA-directed RNA polymerase subunit K/omega
MDIKKTNIPASCITRDLNKLDKKTGNIYETVRIIGKRANQISAEMKHELSEKLEEFQSFTDNLEEVFENREQIEMSKHFERLPKSMLIATQEYIDNQIYWKYPPTEI